MDTQVQEIISKRNSNIDKLQSYLNAGKTKEEKIVIKTIEKIKEAEKHLESLGYTDFDKINEDGTFKQQQETVSQDSSNQSNDTEIIDSETENNNNTEEDKKDVGDIPAQGEDLSSPHKKTQNPDEQKEDNSNTGTNKKILLKNDKVKSAKLGVSIKESNEIKIAKLAKESSRKPNNVVNLMLRDVFDEENNKFNVEFPKKDKIRNTSYLVDEKYAKEIERIAKKTGWSKADIFNVLIEAALKNYI